MSDHLQERESLHAWSLAMAVSSLAAMAVWFAAPDALASWAMVTGHGAWAVLMFGFLFARIGGHRRPADCVTAVRALLCVALFSSFALDPRAAWWKVGLALAIILLDRVDGMLARRHGPTARGAVFDMESDAFFLVTLCGIAHLYLGVGAWVFVIGALRPIYVCVWAALARVAEPGSPNRKGSLRGRLIHVALVIALIWDLTPGIPLAARNAVTVVAVGLICYSYAVDLVASFERRSAREPLVPDQT